MIWAKTHEIRGKTGVLLLLHVQPGASKTSIRGLHQDRLKISVQAPPVEGAANEAMIQFLAKIADVSKSKVHLISGDTSRLKNFWIEGHPDTIKPLLSAALEKALSPK